jgi:hypothetical protein
MLLLSTARLPREPSFDRHQPVRLMNGPKMIQWADLELRF